MIEKLHKMFNNIKKNNFMSGVTDSLDNIMKKANKTQMKEELEEKGQEMITMIAKMKAEYKEQKEREHLIKAQKRV